MKRIRKLLCWMLGHDLMRIIRTPDGDLEKVFCYRCKRAFAMYHPQRWFGEWDWRDQEFLQMSINAHYAPKRSLTPSQETNPAQGVT